MWDWNFMILIGTKHTHSSSCQKKHCTSSDIVSLEAGNAKKHCMKPVHETKVWMALEDSCGWFMKNTSAMLIISVSTC